MVFYKQSAYRSRNNSLCENELKIIFYHVVLSYILSDHSSRDTSYRWKYDRSYEILGVCDTDALCRRCTQKEGNFNIYFPFWFVKHT